MLPLHQGSNNLVFIHRQKNQKLLSMRVEIRLHSLALFGILLGIFIKPFLVRLEWGKYNAQQSLQTLPNYQVQALNSFSFTSWSGRLVIIRATNCIGFNDFSLSKSSNLIWCTHRLSKNLIQFLYGNWELRYPDPLFNRQMLCLWAKFPNTSFHSYALWWRQPYLRYFFYCGVLSIWQEALYYSSA